MSPASTLSMIGAQRRRRALAVRTIMPTDRVLTTRADRPVTLTGDVDRSALMLTGQHDADHAPTAGADRSASLLTGRRPIRICAGNGAADRSGDTSSGQRLRCWGGFCDTREGCALVDHERPLSSRSRKCRDTHHQGVLVTAVLRDSDLAGRYPERLSVRITPADYALYDQLEALPGQAADEDSSAPPVTTSHVVVALLRRLFDSPEMQQEVQQEAQEIARERHAAANDRRSRSRRAAVAAKARRQRLREERT